MQTTHPLSPHQIVAQAIPEDERVWVPQAPNVWFRPLMLNTLNGQWCNLLRVRRAGILSRHRHPAPVHGYVIKGSWRYLERRWHDHLRQFSRRAQTRCGFRRFAGCHGASG